MAMRAFLPGLEATSVADIVSLPNCQETRVHVSSDSHGQMSLADAGPMPDALQQIFARQP